MRTFSMLWVIGAGLGIGWSKQILGSVERRIAPRTASTCTAPTSSVQLDISNVRCLIHNGGDMWWDLVSAPRYEIPKVPPGVPAVHSMFASAVWVGGLDAAGRLRLAAQTYRQSGIDYFAGPLSLQGTTDENTCQQWDRHFVITRKEINAFRSAFQTNPQNLNLGEFPNIVSWPAINPTPGFERTLAPFVDVNNDGDYTPAAGDYPDVLGDMAIWWVYNDKGNVHTETGAPPIGLEVQAMAFAFATTDQVNDMTFYKYRIINRGSLALRDAYMAVWVDADLGMYSDDYVGCDTSRGLGYCYNGDPFDDPSGPGYGLNPPAIGTDFFQGPKDENGNRLKMTNFMYYENDFSVRGNPTNAIHYYNYMRSIWKDGSPLIANNRNGYGGLGGPTNFIYTGHPGGADAVARCPFSPPAAGWDEATAGNSPFDRRYLQSAGPFVLQPGAVNDIIIGVPWARDINGIYGPGGDGRIGSVCLLYQADDVAQALFDNNFQLVDGPDAPDLEIVELDQELILSWRYKNPLSNNYFENYSQVDPVLKSLGARDSTYRFEGYLIYQLRDARVSEADLQDPTRAALIAQCDIKNGITAIVNREKTALPGQPEPLIVDKVMVNGADQGLFYSIRVTEDKFAEGTDPRLKNYQRYYFMIVAYAYNGDSLNNRKFLLGRNNVRRYEAIPHKPTMRSGGTVLNSAYGDGVSVRRLSGQGNGGNFLRLTPEAEQQALVSPYRSEPLQYMAGFGPVKVRVIDPKQVKSYEYRLVINLDTTVRQVISGLEPTILVKEWELYGRPAGSGTPEELLYTSWAPISERRWDYQRNTLEFLLERYHNGTERIIPGHGIAISVRQAIDPGIDGSFYGSPSRVLARSAYPWICEVERDTANFAYYYFIQDVRNGLIGVEIEYADPTKPWLSFFSMEQFGWARGPGLLEGGELKPTYENADLLQPVQDYERGCQITLRSARRRERGVADFPIAPSASLPWFYFYDGHARVYYQDSTSQGWVPFPLLTPLSERRPDLLGFGIGFCGGACAGDAPLYGAIPTEAIVLSRLPSMQIVITPDRSKWSKCLVLESSPSTSLGRLVGAGSPRVAKWRLSRDVIQGDTLAYRNQPLSVASQGFSWFPGYAINLETGERVNILFAEASWFRGDNGDDMLFNPTSTLGTGSNAFGGRHWILVTTYPYDECAKFAEWLCVGDNPPLNFTTVGEAGLRFNKPGGGVVRIDSFYKYVAWATLARVTGPQYEFRHYKDIPTEVRITIGVNKSYRRGPNGESPSFAFSTRELAARVGDVSTAKEALNLIRIVPNPFYGRSGVGRGRYEISQIDTRAKITNLPPRCTVRIFTLNGVLVRTFRKDSEESYIEWDLKNDYGVPIASGVYIIHVDVPGVGEKVIKFFAIMPQIDLNNF
ncbi:MAG: hypothetical protein RMK19_04930 [Bacteroidia bacterium]|nr:hypothetical protein [Bacteroidia bacterium]MDW8015336.1 hypothetical protein [Bacteroidia bacterium]